MVQRLYRQEGDLELKNKKVLKYVSSQINNTDTIDSLVPRRSVVPLYRSLTYSVVFFSTILLGTRKMVRIGSIGLALSDPHFCILSRDWGNLLREYFSLWAIKTSLGRNASAVLDPEVLFSRVARHLACLAFCKLQVGIFQRSVLFID